MKLHRKTPLVLLGDLCFFTAGSVIFACSVKLFSSPNHFAPGGLTGLSTVIHYLTGFPIGMAALLMNLPLFLWAGF